MGFYQKINGDDKKGDKSSGGKRRAGFVTNFFSSSKSSKDLILARSSSNGQEDRQGPEPWQKPKTLLTRLNIYFLENLYRIHIHIRYLHDKVYERGGAYKRYSDSPVSKHVHRASIFAFVISFVVFQAVQNLWPYMFTLKPREVRAGQSQVAWTSYNDFNNNNGATGTTTQSSLLLNDSVNPGDGNLGNLKIADTLSGDGSDGQLTIYDSSTCTGNGYTWNGSSCSNTTFNINTNKSNGRTYADAVNFSVTINTLSGQNQVTISSTPNGLAVGDEVLIINLKGTSSNYTNVGKYETKVIAAINTNTLTLDSNLSNTYDGTTQKVVVQRVPNYSNVVVQDSNILTADSWNGTKGGVLFIRSNGTVTINGNVSMNGSGFGGGQSSENGGETYNGTGGNGGTSGGAGTTGQGGGGGGGWGAGGSGQTGGGGGGGGHGHWYGPGKAGGGGYGSSGGGGQNGYNSNYAASGGTGEYGIGGNGNSGQPVASEGQGGGGGGGATYGTTDLSKLYFGSGGAAGGHFTCCTSPARNEAGGAGGNGGGIIYIRSKGNLTVNGSVQSNGNNGNNGTGSGAAGGGGAGGSAYLASNNNVLVGSSLVTTTNGVGGSWAGNGGLGRIATVGTLTGTTNPTSNSGYSPSLTYYLSATLGGSGASDVGLRKDAGVGLKAKWSSVAFNSAALSSGQAIKFGVRTSDDGITWSGILGNNGAAIDWTNGTGNYLGKAFSDASARTAISGVSASRYLDIVVRLESDGTNTPTLSDVTLTYDNVEAPVLANTSISTSSNGTISSGGTEGVWTKDTTVNVTSTGLTCTNCGTSNQRKIEVEVKPVATAFDGTATGGFLVQGDYNDTTFNSTATISGLTVGTSYHTRLRTIDGQGRVSGWTSYGSGSDTPTAAADFSIEQTPPTGSITINSSATYTNNQVVTVAVTGSDTGGSGLSQVQFSNDGTSWGKYNSGTGVNQTDGTNWTYAETFTASPTSYSWKLSDNDGPKNVYVRIKDNAGNVSSQWIQTTDADFNAGTKTNVATSSNGLQLEADTSTITIGTQVWMKQNLNVGTMLASGSTMPANNGTVEKWCYNNDPNNCTTYGGLYSWNEMMGYSTTPGVQGICPSGFHLPTDAEWKTLEMYLGMTQAQADATDFRGTDQGTKLKSGGSSGFNALPGGFRNISGSFGSSYWLFWTSSESSSTTAWMRLLASGSGGVQRDGSNNWGNKDFGFSVRCLSNSGTPGYVSSGYLESSVKDNSTTSLNYGNISWTETPATGATLTVQARAGNTATPDGTWTAYSANLTSGANLSAYNGKRYIQYKASLTSDAGQTVTPRLEDITIESFPTSSITLDQTAPVFSDANVISFPNGAESWAGGSLHDITWNQTKISDGSGIGLKGGASADGSTSIILEYSSDNQVNWNPIASNLNNGNNSCSPDPGTGCYSWRLPNITAVNTVWVRVRAADHLGNTSSGGDVSNAAFSIQSDSSNPAWPDPTLTLTPLYQNGGTNYTKGNPTLQWVAATDTGSGVDKYQVWAKKIGTDPDFVMIQDNVSKNATTQAVTFTEGNWQWKMRALDGAGNYTDSPTPYAVSVDTTAPTGTLAIDSGNSATRLTTVTLNFTATDNITGITTAKIYNSGDITDSSTCTTALQPAFETYVNPKPLWDITLDTSGAATLTNKGNKKICAVLKDNVGNESAIIYDRIIFDQQDPSAASQTQNSVVYNTDQTPNTTVKASTLSNNVFTGTNTIRVTWSGTADNPEATADVASGIQGYNICRSEDNSSYTKINSSLQTSSPYDDPGRIDGRTYYYRIRGVDNAGNGDIPGSVGTSCSGLPNSWASVTLTDVTAPATPSTFTSNGSNDTQITVIWNPAVDNGSANNFKGKKYILQRTTALGQPQPTCDPALEGAQGGCGNFNTIANVNGTDGGEALIDRPTTDLSGADGDTFGYASNTFTYVDNVPLSQNWYYYRIKVEDSVATPNVSGYIYSLGRGNFAPAFVANTISLTPSDASLGQSVTLTFDVSDQDLDTDPNELTTSLNAGIRACIRDGYANAVAGSCAGTNGNIVQAWASMTVSTITGEPQKRRASYTYNVPANARFGTYTVYFNVKDSVGTGTHDLNDSRTFTLKPTAPSGLTIQGVSSTELRLTWNKNTVNGGIVNYKIYRSTSSGNVEAQTPQTKTLAQLTDNGSTYSYIDSSLSANQIYYYEIRGVDESSNDGAFSIQANSTTPTPAIPLDSSVKMIDASTVEENQNRFALVWSDPQADTTNNTVTASFQTYLIERAENCVPASCVYAPVSGVTNGETTNKYFVDIGLSNTTDYVYRIRTKDSFGNMSRTDLSPVRQGKPGAKPSVSVTSETAGVSTATIKWTATQEAETVVYYGTSAGNYSKMAGIPDRRTAGTEHNVGLTGLTPNTTYYYKIVSKNILGFANDFVEDSFTTTDFNIASMAVSTTTTTATVTWTTNIDADSNVEYKKEAKIGEAAAKSETAGDPTLTRNHEVVIKALKPDTNYTYKIRSVTGDKYIAETQFLTFKTKPYDASQFVISPNASNIAEQNITATSARIVWNTLVATTTWVDYGTSSGSYNQSAGDDKYNTVHVVELVNLTPGTTYYYKVRGTDTNDIEYTSQEYSFTAILLPQIQNAKVKDLGYYSATITWETNVSTDSVVKYGTDTSYTSQKGSTEMTKTHSLTLDNLTDNTIYHYKIVARDQFANETSSSDLTFGTPLDTTGPEIKEVKIDILPMGTDDETAQAIISWTTNKPATTKIEYDEGVIGGTYSKKTTEDPTLNNSHTVIIKELNPSSTYHFKIVSRDKRGNISNSQDYTFVTPTKEKSILQLIIRSLEETFSWVKEMPRFFRGIGKRITGR